MATAPPPGHRGVRRRRFGGGRPRGNRSHLAELAKLDGSIFDHLTTTDRNLFYAGIALLGGFWGAPLVVRELETGTHRLVWSQSVTRTRWLATRLGVSVLAAAAAVGVLTLAVTWWSDRSTTPSATPTVVCPVA